MTDNSNTWNALPISQSMFQVGAKELIFWAVGADGFPSALCLYTGGQAGARVDRRSFICTLAGGFLAARKLLDPVLGEALDHPFTII